MQRKVQYYPDSAGMISATDLMKESAQLEIKTED